MYITIHIIHRTPAQRLALLHPERGMLMMEKILVDMELVQELETIYITKMKAAVMSNDIHEINSLSQLGKQVESLRNTSEILNQNYSSCKDFLNQKGVSQCFDIRITEGMISQSYLSLKPEISSQINNSIIPSEDIEFEVALPKPMGKIYTSYVKKGNRLKERGRIRAFYEEFGLMPGSIITFIQNKHNAEYSIDIKQKF